MPHTWSRSLFLSWFQLCYWPNAFLPAIFTFWFFSMKRPFYLLLNAISKSIRWEMEGKKTKKWFICFPTLKSTPTQRTPDQTKQPEKHLQINTRGGCQELSRVNIEKQPGIPGRYWVCKSKHGVRSWRTLRRGTGHSERHWESLRTLTKSHLNPFACISKVKWVWCYFDLLSFVMIF